MSGDRLNLNYVLDDAGEPVVERDYYLWGRWMQDHERRLAVTELGDGVSVSTVFLGLDHRFGDKGRPLLFETMIFGGAHDRWQLRYDSRTAALAGHALAVKVALVGLHRGAPVEEPEPYEGDSA